MSFLKGQDERLDTFTAIFLMGNLRELNDLARTARMLKIDGDNKCFHELVILMERQSDLVAAEAANLCFSCVN